MLVSDMSAKVVVSRKGLVTILAFEGGSSMAGLMPFEVSRQTKGLLLTGRYWALVFSFVLRGVVLAKYIYQYL